VKQGDKLGMVKVTFNDQTVGQQDLVALKVVNQGGFFRRTFDQARLFFK
jgi:D-alanyl-D-alanine carboxypeptidase (penicillin-binding protein 5/6)